MNRLLIVIIHFVLIIIFLKCILITFIEYEEDLTSVKPENRQ